MNPLYTSRALGRTIDLSQLSELGEAYILEEAAKRYPPAASGAYRVCFQYRIGASDPIIYKRELRLGPPRQGTRLNHWLLDPSAILLQVGEECYRLFRPGQSPSNDVYELLMVKNGEWQPVAVDNLNKDIAALFSAWSAWKDYLNQCRRHPAPRIEWRHGPR